MTDRLRKSVFSALRNCDDPKKGTEPEEATGTITGARKFLQTFEKIEVPCRRV